MTAGTPSAAGRPVIGVLALQGDVREHVAALTAVGALAVPVRRTGELARIDGILLPGGESTAIGRLLSIFGLLEPLRAAVSAGLPAYGTCAGMILLADQVLDGGHGQHLVGGMDVVVRRNAFGRQVDSFEGVVAVDGAGLDPTPMPAVFIRAPVVESVGTGVEVLGRVVANGRQPGAADDARRVGRIVAVRQGDLLATAFHPELTGDLRVHRLFVGMVDRARRGADWRRAGPDKAGWDEEQP